MSATVSHAEYFAAMAADHRRIADFMRGENAKFRAAVIQHGGTEEIATGARAYVATKERIRDNLEVAEFYAIRATEFWRAAAAEMVRGGAVQA